MSERIRHHVRANVVGFVALFFALTGSAIALDGSNTVFSDDIVDGQVKTVDLSAGAVAQPNLAVNSVNGNKIIDGQVGSADIASHAVGTAELVDGNVTQAKLATGAVNTSKIANHSILGLDVADDALTGAQIDESTLLGITATNAWNLSGNSGTGAGDFLGTTDNQPLDLRVNGAQGLRLEPASDGTNQSPNVIGGIADNSVTPGAHSAVIAGGGRGVPTDPATANRVTDHQGVVGGGANNQAGDGAGTVGDSTLATVGGGGNNVASAEAATVGGGFFNSASGFRSTVTGGDSNTASGQFSTAVGGRLNTASGDGSFAAGSGARADDEGAFVWGDSSSGAVFSLAPNQFVARATGGTRFYSAISAVNSPSAGVEIPAGGSGWSALFDQPFDIGVSGSRGLRIDPAFDGTNVSPNVIGGIADNTVTPGVYAATIAGGGRNVPTFAPSANRVTDNFGSIGGGANNQAGDAAGDADDRHFATVGGGQLNFATGDRSTIGGGGSNTASATNSTVAGGFNNTAGGIQSSTVGGGVANNASGQFAVIGGGSDNLAAGTDATVPGGSQNSAGNDYTLAAGRRAQAAHSGSFVWADTTNSDFFSSATNTFNVRATGGTRIVSGVDGSLNPSAGVSLAPGSGSWASLSDRHAKRAIRRVSGGSVLRKLASVPISTWSYRAQDDSIRHIGPMAQDFYRAFGVGESRRRIDSVDADGVALAAIQGLGRKLRVEHARRLAQEQRLDQLEARIAALEDAEGGG